MKKKRILITGFTAPQVGSLRTNGINHLPYVFADAARELGYDVEHRITVLGEDLKGYDAVIVFIMTLFSVTTSYALGALWALRTRPDAAIVVDDWQVDAMINRFEIAARRPDHYLCQTLSATKRPGVDLIRKKGMLRSAIFSVVEDLSKTWEPHPVCAPVFPWGDISKLQLPPKRPIAFDPPPMVMPRLPVIKPVADHHRLKRWVLASLFDQRSWLESQSFSWPVTVYGQEKHGYERLPENEVIDRYGVIWGMLSHPYEHVGSGWWRQRFLHATHAGNVVYGEEAELGPIGHGAHISLVEIERSSWRALRQLADHQRDLIEARLWDRDQFDNFIRRLVA